MRRLTQPAIPHATALATCVGGLQAADQLRFNAAQVQIAMRCAEYLTRSPHHQLFLSTPCGHGHGEQIIVGAVTKDDLTSLYESHMARQGAVGRPLYDQILLVAPGGICPYCGFGHVKTVDHFLGKSRYPVFSVMPANLIPACRDCNFEKSGSLVSAGEQILHPYFEDAAVETDDWLVGEIVQGPIASVRYFIRPPRGWPPDRVTRLENYFRDFDLANRFSVQVGPLLAGLASTLERLPTPALRATHLRGAAMDERSVQRNSWKTAFYEAAHQSDWYCAAGYQAPVPFAAGR